MHFPPELEAYSTEPCFCLTATLVHMPHDSFLLSLLVVQTCLEYHLVQILILFESMDIK